MNHVDRWKNRRRMAWLAMVAGLGFPMLLLGTESQQLGELAYPFYIFVGSVVGAYIGFAVVDDNNFKDTYNNARHRNQYQDRSYRGGNRGGRHGRVDDEWMEAERADRPDGF